MNWGYWGGVGEVGESEGFQAWMVRKGIASIEINDAMVAINSLLAETVSQIAVVKTLRRSGLQGMGFESDEIAFMPSEEDPFGPNRGENLSGADNQQLRSSLNTSKDEKSIRKFIQGILRKHLSLSLCMDEGELKADIPFADYGLDSILGVDWVHAINTALGIELETTVIFDYSSIANLENFIYEQHADSIAERMTEETNRETVKNDKSLFGYLKLDLVISIEMTIEKTPLQLSECPDSFPMLKMSTRFGIF